MGQIANYNGNGTSMNNGDYQRESIRLGSDRPGINQLSMTRNQSAMKQYNGVNSNSIGRNWQQDNADIDNNNELDHALDCSKRDNNGWHQNVFQLATGQMQEQQQQQEAPLEVSSHRRPSLSWLERKNWQGAMSQTENSINSSMEKQQQPQEMLELKLPGYLHKNNNNSTITSYNNVKYGNEMTWGNATEKSQTLNHLEIHHGSQSMEAGKAKVEKQQGIHSPAPAYNYYEHEDDDGYEDGNENENVNGSTDADELDKLQLQRQTMHSER